MFFSAGITLGGYTGRLRERSRYLHGAREELQPQEEAVADPEKNGISVVPVVIAAVKESDAGHLSSAV